VAAFGRNGWQPLTGMGGRECSGLSNKTNKGDDIDYLLLQILNFKNHLESFDIEQKQLIENLIVSLELESE
jgi:hypothetical protein